jgi:hypothetical protein
LPESTPKCRRARVFRPGLIRNGPYHSQKAQESQPAESPASDNDSISSKEDEQDVIDDGIDKEDYEIMYSSRLSNLEQNLTWVEIRLKRILGDGFDTFQEAEEDRARDIGTSYTEEVFRDRERLLEARITWAEAQLEKIVAQRRQIMQRYLRAAGYAPG